MRKAANGKEVRIFIFCKAGSGDFRGQSQNSESNGNPDNAEGNAKESRAGRRLPDSDPCNFRSNACVSIYYRKLLHLKLKIRSLKYQIK